MAHGTQTSRMTTETQTGDRRGIMHRVVRMVELLPARMVGLNQFDQRSHSMDAGSVLSRAASESHGRLSLALILVVGTLSSGTGIRMCYAANFAQPIPLRPVPPRAIGLGKPQEPKPTPEEMQAARGLEYMLVKNMVEQMRKTVPESEFMPKSQSERIFESMLDDEYVGRISESGQLGVADQIVAQMRGRR